MELQQNLKQNQTLALTQSMRYSLDILQMPQWELAQMVQKELENNPLLEEVSQPQVPVEKSDVWYTSLFLGASTEQEWGQYAKKATFQEYLLEQLVFLVITPQQKFICEYLIDSLDRKGYLKHTPQQIAEELGCPVSQVEKAILVLQDLEPTGVAATNLVECLILQLKQREKYSPLAEQLVKTGLDLVANNQLQEIGQLLHCSKAEAKLLCSQIKSLNPIPSQGFDTGETKNTGIVDAVVAWEDGSICVWLNDKLIPHVTINTTYEQSKEMMDSAAWEYCRSHKTRGELLLNSLQRRNATLKRLIEFMVQSQQEFLQERKPLRLLTMAQVAKALNINVSTVSRGIQGVSFYCNGKTYALKQLLAKGCNVGSKEVSSQEVKKQMEELLGQEDKKNPLSDQQLQQMLEEHNMRLSRRTVAKYRAAMGYANATQRKG